MHSGDGGPLDGVASGHESPPPLDEFLPDDELRELCERRCVEPSALETRGWTRHFADEEVEDVFQAFLFRRFATIHLGLATAMVTFDIANMFIMGPPGLVFMAQDVLLLAVRAAAHWCPKPWRRWAHGAAAAVWCVYTIGGSFVSNIHALDVMLVAVATSNVYTAVFWALFPWAYMYIAGALTGTHGLRPTLRGVVLIASVLCMVRSNHDPRWPGSLPYPLFLGDGAWLRATPGGAWTPEQLRRMEVYIAAFSHTSAFFAVAGLAFALACEARLRTLFTTHCTDHRLLCERLEREERLTRARQRSDEQTRAICLGARQAAVRRVRQGTREFQDSLARAFDELAKVVDQGESDPQQCHPPPPPSGRRARPSIDAKEVLAAARAHGEHAARVIDRMDRTTELLSEGSDQIELLATAQPRPFALRAAMERSVQLVRHLARSTYVELSWTAGPDIPAYLVGDDDHLVLVLVNLLTNAIKYTAAANHTTDSAPPAWVGWVHLGAEALHHTDCERYAAVRFSVEDTGVGVEEARADRIFQEYEQGTRTGTGLGLPIARQLVDAGMGAAAVVETLTVEPLGLQRSRGAKLSFALALELSEAAV